jgi:hypothetical protein
MCLFVVVSKDLNSENSQLILASLASNSEPI